MAKVLWLVPIVVILTLAGCGVYTFDPAGKSSVQSVAVERFENQTAEGDLADQMTDLIIDAIIAEGTMSVASLESAEAVLSGTLSGYDHRAFEFDENDEVTAYVVVMDFDVQMNEPSGDSELWSEHMRQEGVYQVADETEEDGRQRAIDRLISDIINRTTRSW